MKTLTEGDSRSGTLRYTFPYSIRKRAAMSGSTSAAVATITASAPTARARRARSTVVMPPTARMARFHAPALRQAISSSGR